MHLFELIITLLVGAAVLTTLSRRIGAPYPVLLAVAGAALALVPADRLAFRLDPDLALTLFVAPVLADAAAETSLRDLRANWVPVFSLVLFCVVVTIAAVAVVARWLMPDMPWAVAIALGAIVAPPDATAATSILRLISPPHRVMVILEGESLLNDASALLIYRFAVGVALGETFHPLDAIPALLLTVAGGVILGLVAGWLFPRLTRRIDDNPVQIVTQFISTFAVWIAAERVGASPIIAVVVFAMTLSHWSAPAQGAETRRMSFAVWDVAVYVLNALAFILIGLQLHGLRDRAGAQAPFYLTFALAVLAAVVLARIGWIALYNRGWAVHRRIARWRGRDAEEGPSWRASLVVSWCGMRGIVTLATALALPYGEDGRGAFPHRDLLISAAFLVVLGTLVIQGFTLKPLMHWLGLGEDDEVGREERLARREVTRAAVRMLERRHEPEAGPLFDEYKARLDEERSRNAVTDQLRLKAIGTERAVLHRLRRNRTIGDDAYRTVEEELDLAEGHAEGRKRAVVDPAPPGEEGDRDA
jgi:Na+/H+ antiporter